ncbi:MAG: hypothetical protein KDJ35_06525 [Alphaproteobacteria bacterium]|nr:hypothetical protein [Alphaproteobacteria bacterium]
MSVLKKSWIRNCFRLRKIDAVGALAFMFTFFPPNLTSSSPEEYMKNNDIPPELAEGLNLDNIKIYDNNGLYSAHYAGAKYARTSDKDWKDRWKKYKEGFLEVFSDEASIRREDNTEEKQVILIPQDKILSWISKGTGIPEDHIEISDEDLKNIYYWIFLHEISHGNESKYQDSETYLSENPRNNIKIDSLNFIKLVLSGEIGADYSALKALKEKCNPDSGKTVIAYRSFNIGPYDPVHDTAYYLEKMDMISNSKFWPDLKPYPDIDKNIYKAIGANLPQYFETSSDFIYLEYLAALDALEKISESTNPLLFSDNEKRFMADKLRLFVEGIEYFAPTKAQEARLERRRIKYANTYSRNTNDLSKYVSLDP